MTPGDRQLLARAKRDALAARGTLRLGRADGIRSEAFIAHWPGVCNRCTKPIKRGAVIRFHADYDGLCHDECQPARRRPKKANPTPIVTGSREPQICSSCWTAHAGECW